MLHLCLSVPATAADPKLWSVGDTLSWLADLQVPQYQESFAKNEISGKRASKHANQQISVSGAKGFLFLLLCVYIIRRSPSGDWLR